MLLADTPDGFSADSVLATGHDASAEPVLAVNDIQGNVLPGFGTAFMTLLCLKIDDAAGGAGAARRWLRELSPHVSSLNHVNSVREVRRAVARATGARPKLPDVLLNVALGFPALAPFGLETSRIFDAPFVGGMAGTNLQDPQDANGLPLDWMFGATPETTPDVLLIIGSDEEASVSNAASQLLASTGPGGGSGLRLIHRDDGVRLPGDIEHFGFRDGISQPGVRGRLSERPDHVLTRRYFDPSDFRAAEFARPGQPLIWPGQFIFGYPVQPSTPEEPRVNAIPPHPWMEFGSFMVFRRLRQDVRAFRRFAAAQAEAASQALGREISPELVEAWIVGRWPDGTPLTRSPLAPDPSTAADDMANNFFGYAVDEPDARVIRGGSTRDVPGAAHDSGGERCPHFAHIRKVNLRDKPTDQGSSLNFRILRRGITYGRAFEEGEPAGIDRGLLFVSYQRTIEPQFLTLSATWMNSHDAPEGFGHDLLVGQDLQGRFAERTDAETGRAVSFRSPAGETWVTPTGGAFLFSPRISVLTQL